MPTLRPGQIVVLDNRSVHKSAQARALVEAVGCRLVVLPTSSPDVNPIAHACATTKQAVRRVEARSFATVVAAVGAALLTITPADARAFFVNAGFPFK